MWGDIKVRDKNYEVRVGGQSAITTARFRKDEIKYIMTNECIVIIDPQKDFTSIHGNYAQRHVGIGQILDAKANIKKLLTQLDKNHFVIVNSDYSINKFGEGL